MVKLTELKQIQYFNGLKDEDLVSIAARVVERRFNRNENIVIEGISCQGLYIVRSGRIKIFKTSEEGREHIFYYARKGDTFCDICLFHPDCSPLSASASTASVVFFIRDADLKNLVKKIPDLAFKLLEQFSLRMNQLVEMVEDLSFKNVPGRLAKILVDFVRKEGIRQGDNIVLKRSITLYEMASMVGTVREVITRSLQKLERDGVLRIERNEIEILNLHKLEEIAGTPVEEMRG